MKRAMKRRLNNLKHGRIPYDYDDRNRIKSKRVIAGRLYNQMDNGELRAV